MSSPNPLMVQTTKLGQVAIIKMGDKIPQGFRWLFLEESYWILSQLKDFCYEKLPYQYVAFATGLFAHWFDGTEIKDIDNSECKYYFAISPDVRSFDINDFWHKTKQIIDRKFVLLPIGLVIKIPLSDEIPDKFRAMKITEGRQYKKDLTSIMEYWSIVAFETGKIDGYGHGNRISNSYGTQCGQRFIISIDQ